jgi:hypothetical protein
MICNYNGGLARDSFVSDGSCEVDGEEDIIGQSSRRYKWGFEKQAGVVPGRVG